jgi:hypothetical protein
MIRPIYGQNFRSKLRYLIYCSISKKWSEFSRKTITRLRGPMGKNPFKLLLVSLSSTKWYISDSKRSVTLGDLPSLERLFQNFCFCMDVGVYMCKDPSLRSENTIFRNAGVSIRLIYEE